MDTTTMIQQVWDRQEIEQLMYKHARSLDRMDADLMKSTYWEEAIEDHFDNITGAWGYNDNAWEFVPMAMEGFSKVKSTQHRISNILIELNGDKATAETYVMAYHIHTDENNVNQENIVGGRHLFKLEKRNNEWRILHRSTIFDWNKNQKSTEIWTSEEVGKRYKSFRNKNDFSYTFFKNK